MCIKNLDKQKDMLCLLSKCKPAMRKAILSKDDKNLVAAICQTIHNMLEGNLSINNNDFKNLKKYKKTFRKLIEKSKLRNKKEILIQKGGFLQFLIPAVISGITSIMSSYISNKISDQE
jgi:hypothetical protein